MADKLKIGLVDDHKMIRQGIKSFFCENDSYEIVGEAEDGLKAIDMVTDHQPDLLLADILMPNMNGIEMTEKLKVEFPDLKIIALTMLNENHHIKQMMNAGASGYLLKNCSEEELNEAISEVTLNSNHPELVSLIETESVAVNT